MATHHGDEGEVYSGANAVAEVTDFNYNETIALAEDSAKGDTKKSYKTGRKDGTGTVKGWWDPSDTNGQNTLRTGQTVDLHLYPEGKTATYTDLTGSVIIESIDVSSPNEGITEFSMNFKGVLTEGAVPP